MQSEQLRFEMGDDEYEEYLENLQAHRNLVSESID